MMTKEEIAAFWKLSVALKPILGEDYENIPLTPEGEQALNEYSRLKELMKQEMDGIQAGEDGGSSSSQQSQESTVPSSMSLNDAYNVVGQAVGELVNLYKATINDATPKAEVKKFEDHIGAVVEALQIIGTELFAKPKIQ